MINSLIDNKIQDIITNIAKHYKVSRLSVKVELMANQVIIKHYNAEGGWDILDQFNDYSLFLRKWNN
jgi:hypothetical protein